MKKTLSLIIFLTFIFGLAGISNADTVVSLYGDKDGFGIGGLPGPMADSDIFAINPDASDPPYTDILMYNTVSWTHSYSISGLGTIKSASLEVFAVGLGYGGVAAPIYINGQYLGTLTPGEDPFVGGNIARLDTSDLMPFVSYLTGSTTFTIITIPFDGWALDYSQLTISHAVPEPGILILLGISMASVVGLRRWWKD